MITATSAATASAASAGSNTSSTNAAGSQDRFLKLLVAQLSNQDPMNPMDNAQMTSQMAQISTVTGVQQVDATLKGLAGQFAAMQMMQAGALVGRNVLVQGNQLAPDNGTAAGAFDLDLKADSVKVEILSGSGQVVDTLDLGALGAGRHDFSWDASKFPGVTTASYRLVATIGGATVPSSTLVRDKVVSVSSDNGTMHLQLKGHGSVTYDSIRTIL